MRRFRLTALLFGAILAMSLCVNGLAQVSNFPSGGSTVLGPYTVATLPDCTQYQARYAFVTDLGGGADTVICDGVNWKHIRQGVVTDVTVQTTVTVTPLTSPPVMRLSGNAFSAASTVTIATTNLYPGYTLQIVVPSGVLAAVGSLGVNVAGGTAAAIPVVAGSWEDLQWNGTALVVLRKGTL